MSNTPRYVGFLDPPYNVTLTDDSGHALDLTGCTPSSFTLTMLNVNTGNAKTCNGAWTVGTPATSGNASYAYTASDMDTAGIWDHYVTVKLPSEPSPREFDPDRIQILPGTVGAGASPPGVLPSPAATLPLLNIRDFSGVGDGITDNTIPIFNARAAARALGGARIFYGPGTFLSGNQDISNDTGIYHEGSGKGATVIKLKNGANTDLFSGQTNLMNIGASRSSGPIGTLRNFGFSHMTLDGNRANQSGGPSYPLRFYGYAHRLSNLNVRNGYSGNIQADWNGSNDATYPTDYPEPGAFAQWDHIQAYQSGGIGIEFGGPNDSQWSDIYGFLDVSHNVHIGPNAPGLTISNMHTWSPGNWYAPPSPSITYDTFQRANQAGWGTASSGDTWTKTGSGITFSIVSSAGNIADGGGSEANNIQLLGNHTVADVDMYVLLNAKSSENFVGPLWHYTNVSNYYAIAAFEGVLYLQRVVSGVTTNIATAALPTTITHDTWYHVQMIGSAIKVRVFEYNTTEPNSWLISTTDTALAPGQVGIIAFTNGINALVKQFYANTPHVYTNAVSLLCETNGVMGTNCIAEGSDTVQVVVLGGTFQWIGGQVYDPWQHTASGFQIGQQAGESPYPGQVLVSGGLTQGVAPIHCRINTYVAGCDGPNGALWLDNDGGYNVFDLSINADLKGVDRAGSLSAQSTLHESYDDGTHLTTGTMQLDSGVMLNKSSTIYSGSGAPSNSLGSNGDFYFRTDTPGTVNQRLYVKSAGAWVGIL